MFLITGAAGSIVSAITADLAAASGGTFYLLDLVPEPDPDNPDLERFVTDKDGLKRDLFARIQARGERATPALVEKELAALERAQAARSAIDAVRAAGGTAHYFSVDLTDADAVAKVIAITSASAAGASTCCCMPPASSAATSCRTKTRANSTWSSTSRPTAGSTCCTPSATCRWARRWRSAPSPAASATRGQTDYSSANDLLCKITSSFRTTRPATRGIAIDWTAWGGIGMATRGSIPKMMEMAGIDMLPPEAGVPLIRRELTAGGTRGEMVVGQRLGVLLNEWDATGGLDASRGNSPTLTRARTGRCSAGSRAAMGCTAVLTVETTLDPESPAVPARSPDRRARRCCPA